MRGTPRIPPVGREYTVQEQARRWRRSLGLAGRRLVAVGDATWAKRARMAAQPARMTGTRQRSWHMDWNPKGQPVRLHLGASVRQDGSLPPILQARARTPAVQRYATAGVTQKWANLRVADPEGRVATNPAFLMADCPLPAPPLRDEHEFLRNFKFVEADAKGRHLHDGRNPVLRALHDFHSRLLACFIG